MGLIKTILEYILIIVLVVLLRIYVITPVEVDGPSMNSTLYDGDIMLLNIVGYHMHDIKRFDIVVIKYGDENLIKRVIGLPGEFIEFKENNLYINNKKVDEPFLKESTEDFNLYDIGYAKIPNNKYFVMGDNRDNSTDSRIIGFINREDILGKAGFILFPFNHFGFVK